MKKLTVFILIFILLFTISCNKKEIQNPFEDVHFGDNTLSKLNGEDWNQFNVAQKYGYIEGFLTAYYSIYERFLAEYVHNSDGADIPNEFVDKTNEWFFSYLSVDEIGGTVDYIYQNSETLIIPIYQVIMMVMGKDYWNQY